MEKQENIYYIFQTLIVFNKNKFNLFNMDKYEDNVQGRNCVFRSIIEKLSEKKTHVSLSKKSDYIVFRMEILSSDFVSTKIAKHKLVDVFEEGDVDISKKEYDSLPYLHTYINLRNQTIFVEKKESIISASVLQSILSEFMYVNSSEFPINTFVVPVTEEVTFWNAVNQGPDQIYELDFELIAPNILGFDNSIKELMRNTRDEINSDSVNLKFANKHGLLIVTESYFDDLVKYTTRSGSWKVKVKANGETTIFSSSDIIKKGKIEEEISNFFDTHKLNSLLSDDEWHNHIEILKRNLDEK
jgi:hypothetical protein